MLFRILFASVFLFSLATSCDVTWPNTTETKTTWWPCSSGPATVVNVQPTDKSGVYEYPIKLTEPCLIQTTLNNPNTVYTTPGLKQTIKVAQWNAFSCAWSNLPTFGLLTNIDACTNGVPCPIKTGQNQILNLELDFSDTPQIVALLKNDKPYQLTYILHDDVSGEEICMSFQARCLTE